MKYAVSTYSFFQLISKGKMTQLDCISKAKELGFDGIEIALLDDDLPTFDEDYAKLFAEEAKKHDIVISNFVFGADFINGCEGKTQEEIKRVKKLIDIAEILGTPCIRHDVLYSLGSFRSFELALPTIADACRQITEYAEKKGIRTMSENHGFISQDSVRVEKLFNTVNHKNFSLLADVGNFLCVDENPIDAISRIAPYTEYVHVKDFIFKSGSEPYPGDCFITTRGANYIRGTVLGHGCVPVKQCLNILKRNGYDGFITIEYEGMEPAIEAIKLGLENLKNYIND